MKYIKTTETDIIAEEGKQATETTIITFISEPVKGFQYIGEIKMPKSGRINFKRHILPHLLEGKTKNTENATAKIAVATDGKGNVCLSCLELTDRQPFNARE